MRQLLAGMPPRLGVSQVPQALPVGLHNNNPKFTREATISILAVQFCLLSLSVRPGRTVS
jgi:hypothetical protein